MVRVGAGHRAFVEALAAVQPQELLYRPRRRQQLANNGQSPALYIALRLSARAALSRAGQ